MHDIFLNFISNPMFGICLTVIAYWLGNIISSRIKNAIFNPVIISLLIIIPVLRIFNIKTEYYQNGGEIIKMFLLPATAALGYAVYKQMDLLKKYLIPVLAGCLTGSLTALASVFALAHLFGLNGTITASVLPKSVTAPIAVDISRGLGGVPSITFICVAISGMTGAIFAPLFVKMLHIRNKVAVGVAIGTCSHAFGTSRALEIGETEGAMSGLAIGIAGVMTSILVLLF
ncbi:LrgB family protein [Parasporobacterium paucivorans]|uniref:TIGR00659 family protein n=1 Tax=Parasporobacterium paucivorans DSM 15970 TaxID=1122934 RepID=A0A1M6HNW9_9FIRM|nr:LrgB family protein [Parasporobacterium paucivorans]SHJ23834.1 TIGR00659 family protein [Parasporobacterium paucivorans DSM 15970]